MIDAIHENLSRLDRRKYSCRGKILGFAQHGQWAPIWRLGGNWNLLLSSITTAYWSVHIQLYIEKLTVSVQATAVQLYYVRP